MNNEFLQTQNSNYIVFEYSYLNVNGIDGRLHFNHFFSYKLYKNE